MEKIQEELEFWKKAAETQKENNLKILSELDVAKQDNAELQSIVDHQGFSILERREQIETLKQENERLNNEVNVSIEVIKRQDSNYKLQHENYRLLVNEAVSLQQRLKQAEEALEELAQTKGCRISKNALSLIRGEELLPQAIGTTASPSEAEAAVNECT